MFLPRRTLLFLVPATLLAALSVSSACAATNFSIPLQQKTLPNGLTVIVSEDHSAPTFGLCIAYRIGFRLEPEGRTGFAHLFEHMMFEGTPVSPKGTMDHIIEGGGGNLNGDTRWDYTEYIETAPVSALDPVLWLEADRMKALDFSTKNLDNQRQVVEEEVRVNVLNQPYGLFFAIDLPMKAYDTYPDSHNFDINGKAGVVITREDVRNAVTGPSYKETIFELNRMATAPVGDQELTAAKRYLLGTLGFRLQSRASVARRLATLWVYGLDTQFIRKDADDIMSATAAQVQQASQRYLAPDKMTVVAVGEDKVVHEQFAPFSLPVVDAPKP
jgi:predicted Zn-dependent peptidase